MNSEITVEGFHTRVSAFGSVKNGQSLTFCPDGVETKFGPVDPILLYIETL